MSYFAFFLLSLTKLLTVQPYFVSASGYTSFANCKQYSAVFLLDPASIADRKYDNVSVETQLVIRESL